MQDLGDITNKSEYISTLQICTQNRYAVFGEITAVILFDLPVTIAIAMLFGESNKLTH